MVSPATRAQVLHAKPTPIFRSPRQVRSIVVSGELEMRKLLLRTLEGLGVDVVVCNRIADAEEFLLKLPVDLVFCDERLPDGAYTDLIHVHHSENCIPRVVVTTRHGEWDLYFHALAKGAFDVIRCPCNATDVEMTMIRALREGDTFATASA